MSIISTLLTGVSIVGKVCQALSGAANLKSLQSEDGLAAVYEPDITVGGVTLKANAKENKLYVQATDSAIGSITYLSMTSERGIFAEVRDVLYPVGTDGELRIGVSREYEIPFNDMGFDINDHVGCRIYFSVAGGSNVSIQIQTKAIPMAFCNQAYSFAMEVKVSPLREVTWKINKETPLPRGLQLNAKGQISGIPSTVQQVSVQFYVSAQDPEETDTCILNMKVYRQLTILNEKCWEVSILSFQDIVLSAEGGVEPYQ